MFLPYLPALETHPSSKSISSEASCFVRALGSSSDKTLCLAAAGLHIRQLRCMPPHNALSTVNPNPHPTRTPSTQTLSSKTQWSPTPWIKTSCSPTPWFKTPWTQHHDPQHHGPITMVQNTMAPYRHKGLNYVRYDVTPYLKCLYLCSKGYKLCSKGEKFCSKGLKFYPSNIQ